MTPLAVCPMLAGAVFVREHRYYLIWRRLSDTSCVALEITAPGLRRNQIPIDRLSDLVAMGLPGGDWAIQSHPVRMRPTIWVGKCPDDVWEMVGEAMTRELATAKIEASQP